MKIAITGAHGVGKTTLTKALAAATGLAAPVPTPMHNPTPGQLKSLQDCNNEEVLQLSQRRYTERIIQEHSLPDVISDGSVLHEWVYASVRLSLGIFPTEDQDPAPSPATEIQLNLIDAFAEEALTYAEETYDEIFFIPVEFPLAKEGAPISDRFQNEAHLRLYELLSMGPKPVRILRGSVQERLDTLLAVLHQAGHRLAFSSGSR